MFIYSNWKKYMLLILFFFFMAYVKIASQLTIIYRFVEILCLFLLSHIFL